jgi:DNA-binding transcriptional regulator YhcF (GntR family)
MDILVNRRGGVPVRDQLVTQLELKILGGELAQGQRLPSVRALARRLKVHHNTVSAAYQDLEAAGHVELRRGSGVFVRDGGARAVTEASGLDEMIRLALHAAFAKGFHGADVRAAVERWLAAAPPDRVVVVDPSREMAEIIVEEIRQSLGVPASAATMDDLARDPALLSGALVVALPYHEAKLAQTAPGSALQIVHLEFPAADRDTVNALAPGSIVLVVSHAATVLPFATVFLRSLRGSDIHVEVRLRSAPREWRRLLAAADFVLTDVLATREVRAARPRRLREVRMLSASSLEHLQQSLKVVVPRGDSRTRGPARA